METKKYKIRVRRTTFTYGNHETSPYDGDLTHIEDQDILSFDTKKDAKDRIEEELLKIINQNTFIRTCEKRTNLKHYTMSCDDVSVDAFIDDDTYWFIETKDEQFCFFIVEIE